MRLLFINPNTTEVMTEMIAVQARRAAGPGTEIIAVNPRGGPPAIETPADEHAATSEVLRSLGSWDVDTCDAVVIACFGDPGLDDVRRQVDVPVVGIAEAAMMTASAIGRRFSIVCALESAVPMMEDLADRYGLSNRLASVRATGVSVLELAQQPEESFTLVRRQLERCFFEDRVDTVCLGCASMGPIAAELSTELGVPVVEGVRSATKLLEAALTQSSDLS